MQQIRIATRESALAMWQAEHVATRLRALHPHIQVDLVPMTTRGDQLLDQSLSTIGGKGLFLKELEHAILNGQADIAVHSLKDVPMQLENNFELVAILERADPFDGFVSNRYSSFSSLPIGAVVGTSSLRRQAQLRAMRPDLRIKDLRGNVNTRLRKLDDDQYEAIILACCGLQRLGFDSRIRERLHAPTWIPAVAQGAIAIECLSRDIEQLQPLLAPLVDKPTSICVSAERAMNLELHGSCQVPIAAYCEIHNNRLVMSGLVGDASSGEIIRADVEGDLDAPVILGKLLAQKLKNLGVMRLLEKHHH